jgi:hypothetical protein
MLLLKAENRSTSTNQLPLQDEWRERVLAHLDMLDPKQLIENKTVTLFTLKSQDGLELCSGLLYDQNTIGSFVKGTVLAITDPFGKFERKIKSPNDGYIINANLSSIVYQGDAIYHISKTLEK